MSKDHWAVIGPLDWKRGVEDRFVLVDWRVGQTSGRENRVVAKGHPNICRIGNIKHYSLQQDASTTKRHVASLLIPSACHGHVHDERNFHILGISFLERERRGENSFPLFFGLGRVLRPRS